MLLSSQLESVQLFAICHKLKMSYKLITHCRQPISIWDFWHKGVCGAVHLFRLNFFLFISAEWIPTTPSTGTPRDEKTKSPIYSLSILWTKGTSSGRCWEEISRKVPKFCGRNIFLWELFRWVPARFKINIVYHLIICYLTLVVAKVVILCPFNVA